MLILCRRSSSAMWSWRKGGQTGQLHEEGHAHPAGQVIRAKVFRCRCLKEKVNQLLFRTVSVFSSLPEVPALVDVPCVSAQFDDSLLSLLRDRVARHGAVSSHPPVQIEELQERPGSILVRWCKVSRGKRDTHGAFPGEETEQEACWSLQSVTKDLIKPTI